MTRTLTRSSAGELLLTFVADAEQVLAKAGAEAQGAEIGVEEAALPWPAGAYQDGRLMTKAERRALADSDPLWFGRLYLADYFGREMAPFHGTWNERGKAIAAQGGGAKDLVVAFRGGAKSTFWTLLYPIWCAVTGRKHFVPVLSATQTVARETFLSPIKAIFEQNELIRHDYGNMVPSTQRVPGPARRVKLTGFMPVAKTFKALWTRGSFVTTSGVKFLALGINTAMRGIRHGPWRPDLFIMDDLERDDTVRSKDQRDKLDELIASSVLFVGDTYTDYIWVGTILHPDAVAARAAKRAAWRSSVIPAVVQYADNQALWDQWRAIYTDKAGFDGDDDARLAAARAFFDAHQSEMLRGAKVAWPHKWDYYQLMCLRVEGEAKFDKEMQHKPKDLADMYFDLQCYDAPGTPPEKFGLPPLEECICVGALDPSLGKKGQQTGRSSKKGDPMAIIFELRHIRTGLKYVLIADIRRLKPDEIMEALFSHVRWFRDNGMEHGWLRAFAIEAQAFQEFFADKVAERSAEEGIYLPVVPIHNSADKIMRIQRLQPDINNGYLRCSTQHRGLLDQAEGFPDNQVPDDGLDALEMADRLMDQQIRTASTQTVKRNKKELMGRAPLPGRPAVPPAPGARHGLPTRGMPIIKGLPQGGDR